MAIGWANSKLKLNEPAPTDNLNRDTGGSETLVFDEEVEALDEPLRHRTADGDVVEVGQVQVYPFRHSDLASLRPGYEGTLTWPDGSSEEVRVVQTRRLDTLIVLERVN